MFMSEWVQDKSEFGQLIRCASTLHIRENVSYLNDLSLTAHFDHLQLSMFQVLLAENGFMYSRVYILCTQENI